MKTAEQWHNDGVTNIASTLHRVDVKEIRAIQIDTLREAREIINTGYDDGIVSRDYNLQRIDKLIRELELR